MASACKRGMLSVSSVQGFPRTAEWRCGYSSTLLASITAPFGTGRAKPYLIIIMKKRTSFLNLTMLAAATLLSGNLTSCSSADGDSYVPSPTITDANGTAVQVTSVGNFRITYDEKGKLASLNEGGGTYVLQDDKFTFNNGAIRAEVFLNSDGLVTKIKYQETSQNEKDEGTLDYSYSSDRRLKSCSVTGEGTYRHGSVEVSYNGKGTVDYTWQNGNLTQAKVESKTTSKSDGGNYQMEISTIYTYSYGTEANTCKQLPYYMGEAICGLKNYGGMLSAIGHFGHGPSFLPTVYTETVTEIEDGYLAYGPHTDTYTFSFTQNSNGTLKSEKCNSNQIYYGYYNGITRSGDISTPTPEQQSSILLHNIFRHRKQ